MSPLSPVPPLAGVRTAADAPAGDGGAALGGGPPTAVAAVLNGRGRGDRDGYDGGPAAAAGDGGAGKRRADSDVREDGLGGREAGRDGGGDGGPDTAAAGAAAEGDTPFRLGVSVMADRGSLLYEAGVRDGRGAPPAGWRGLGSYLRSHWLPRRSMLTGLGRAASNSVRGETDLPVSFLQKLSRVALVCALLVWPIRSVFFPTRTGGACRRRAKTSEAA